MAREYGQRDPFRGIDKVEVERVRTLAGLLERRSQSADETAVRVADLDLLDIQPGEQVQGRPAVRGTSDLVPLQVQHLADEIPDVRVVVDDEDGRGVR